MPDAERERVLAVKRGDVPALADVLARIEGVQSEIEDPARFGTYAAARRARPRHGVGLGSRAHRPHWGWA